MKKFFNSQKGFTLVELLIVIAILGILAAGLLSVIDPLEQIERGRDATRIAQVNQLGNAMTAYFANQGTYPPIEATWIESLVNAGELKTASVKNTTNEDNVCAGKPSLNERMENGFCYATEDLAAATTTDKAIVFVRLMSKAQRKKANSLSSTCLSSGPISNVFFFWSSNNGKAGIMCTTGTPATNEGPRTDSQPL